MSPTGVAVDRSGNVFIADTRNHTIRKITPTGVVTSLAGAPGTSGTADGPGLAARFSNPGGVAVDGDGNVFVADSQNSAIRKITVAGVVTTLAGLAGSSGNRDGTGSAARFAVPTGVAVDGSGTIYVADSNNSAIRKITATGVVTTVAGTDATGRPASFRFPYAVTVDGSGNIFVADAVNNTIQKITANGVVTTLAGTLQSGSVDGAGSVAQFNQPLGVAVDLSGNVFVADTGNHTLRRITSAGIVTTVAGAAGGRGSANGTGSAARFDGPGGVAVDASGNAFVADSGNHAIRKAVLADFTGPFSRLANLSTRGLVPAGGDLTVGFVIRGSGGKSLLVRAVGPTLGSFGVAGALTDPRLDLIPAGASAATNTNDDWAGGAVLANAFAAVGAFALPTASKDAALIATLPAAGYSARITSSLTGGIAIAEVYDRDASGAASQLVNVSTLGFVGTGPQALVPGFVIDGPASKLLLIRAVGPGLAPFGVGDTLADPQLAIIPLGSTTVVASNDNWSSTSSEQGALTAAFQSAGAFALTPGSKDAAVIVRLPPGGYTVTVSGVGDTTGRALVEIYDLDP